MSCELYVGHTGVHRRSEPKVTAEHQKMDSFSKSATKTKDTRDILSSHVPLRYSAQYSDIKLLIIKGLNYEDNRM